MSGDAEVQESPAAATSVAGEVEGLAPDNGCSRKARKGDFFVHVSS
jgi:hypothetical protein